MAHDSYISLRKVQVDYNDYVAGLRNVSFNVEQGEFVFLCGQTGSGKSTIIRLLSSQVRPTKGEAIFDGRPLSLVKPDEIPELRRKIGIVPQDFGLLPNKKVWENVGYAMRAVGKTKIEVREQVPNILEQVNILHRADAYPNELSGGEQQRVAIARALINNPPLLLADEPTGNLDPAHSDEIIDILLELNAKGTTVIVATHDINQVVRAGKRIIMMAGGRVDEEIDSSGHHHKYEPEESGDGEEITQKTNMDAELQTQVNPPQQNLEAGEKLKDHESEKLVIAPVPKPLQKTDVSATKETNPNQPPHA
jgi:cell division transport system ATP-binding protein